MTAVVPKVTAAARPPLLAPAASVIQIVERAPLAVFQLLARCGVAAIFWRSGRTKVDGFEVTEFTVQLFREEYRVPLLPPEIAAHLAAAAEHLFPVMLVLGLGARLGAAGLLGMTVVIQLFVFPQSWPDHLLWAGALGLVLAYGPGTLSLDHLIRRRCLGDQGRV